MTNQQLNAIGVTRKGFSAYESFCFMCKLSAVVIIAASVINIF